MQILQVAAKINSFGFDVTHEDVVTSGWAAAQYLATRDPPVCMSKCTYMHICIFMYTYMQQRNISQQGSPRYVYAIVLCMYILARKFMCMDLCVCTYLEWCNTATRDPPVCMCYWFFYLYIRKNLYVHGFVCMHIFRM